MRRTLEERKTTYLDEESFVNDLKTKMTEVSDLNKNIVELHKINHSLEVNVQGHVAELNL